MTTRYEAYLNTYYALQFKASQINPSEYLLQLIDDMNPFVYNFEGSKDYEIYDRFSNLWMKTGSTVTNTSENEGFVFAKTFFSKAPKTDKRYMAGLNIIERLDESEWRYANYWQAISGTYQLLYYVLFKIENKDNQLISFLERMNPFHGGSESYSKDPVIANQYFKICEKYNPLEVSYQLAFQFVYSLKLPFLLTAFNKIKESDWNEIRYEKPYIFRMIFD